MYVTYVAQLFSSDDFIQAQQQLARWASEDVVSVVVMDQQGGSDSSAAGPSSTTATMHETMMPLMSMGNGHGLGVRDYYPSPPSTETESSGSVIQPQPRRVLIDAQNGDSLTENKNRFQEYKH